MQDGSIDIAPEKISEAIINLTNKNKMWEKKLSEYEKINNNLTNQLKNLQSKNYEDKLEKLNEDVISKNNQLNILKIQIEKESNKNKNNIKQLNATINEMKSNLDVSKSQIKSKENEISDLKKKLKSI